MKHILLPTDFSDNSIHAIQYALQLFLEINCHFYLLHSYSAIADNMNYMQISAAPFEVDASAKAASQERLQGVMDMINTTFKNPLHTFETVSSFNVLIEEVKDLVSKKNIHYVIMGTKGATGAKEILFGSNTVNVFKKATCPVLAIPETATYQKLQDVLFSTDYDIAFHDKNMQPLLEITGLHKANVHVLHVTLDDKLNPKQIRHQAELKVYLENMTSHFHEVANTEVTAAIMEFQTYQDIDMLAMIHSKKSFFENLFFKSRINDIGHHIKIPFLVIPEKG